MQPVLALGRCLCCGRFRSFDQLNIVEQHLTLVVFDLDLIALLREVSGSVFTVLVIVQLDAAAIDRNSKCIGCRIACFDDPFAGDYDIRFRLYDYRFRFRRRLRFRFRRRCRLFLFLFRLSFFLLLFRLSFLLRLVFRLGLFLLIIRFSLFLRLVLILFLVLVVTLSLLEQLHLDELHALVHVSDSDLVAYCRQISARDVEVVLDVESELCLVIGLDLEGVRICLAGPLCDDSIDSCSLL